MKLSRWALAAALACSLWGRGSFAQEPNYYNSTPAPVAAGSLGDEGEDFASGIPAQAVSYGAMLGDEGGPDGACACDCGPCCFPLADLGEPFKLFDGCFFKERNIQAGGWIAQSFTWNPYNPSDRYNGPMTWTDRANEYQLNEIYGFIGKAANTEGCGWDYGYRADVLYGTNYRWCTAAGLESSLDNQAFYGVAFTQAYAEIARNDLTVKIGKFYSPVGYYVVGTANNFFPFLPYTFQYGEPFTHTGVMATWKQNDKLVLGSGFTKGWDNFDNSGNPNLGYLGTATYTRDNGDTLAYVCTLGREPNFSGSGFSPSVGSGFSTRYLQTLVYTHKFSDDVLGVAQSDFGTQEAATWDGRTAHWYGANGYLYWNQTCRLQWGANAEWFRDEQGFRVAGAVPSFGSPNARGYPQSAATGGFAGNFFAFSIGPKYFFTPNLYTRAAFRADWYDGIRNSAGNMPFDDGTKSHQQVVAFDLVYTF